MPRGKRAEQLPLPISESAPTLAERTDEDLTKQYFTLDDWLESESKRFGEHIKPTKTLLEYIKDEFLRRLNERKADSTKTDAGTAYKSTIMNISISPDAAPYNVTVEGVPMEPKVGRDALLDFCLDHWDEIGNDLLMISAQKDAVKRWMEEHNGAPPPGIKVGFFTRVNLRRS